MIKSKGNYIAVKVPEGSYSFNLFYERYLCDGKWKLSYVIGKKGSDFEQMTRSACSTGIPITEKIKIIGLISEITGDKQKIMDHMAGIFWASHQSPVLEWNQWLIIKKNG